MNLNIPASISVNIRIETGIVILIIFLIREYVSFKDFLMSNIPVRFSFAMKRLSSP